MERLQETLVEGPSEAKRRQAQEPTRAKRSWVPGPVDNMRCACPGPAICWDSTWVRTGLHLLLGIG